MSRIFPRWKRGSERSREDGATLIELLISMSILGIVLAATFTVLVSVQRGLGIQIDRSANATQAGVVMQQLEKEIQSAEAFSVCSSYNCSATVPAGTPCTATSATSSSLTTCYLIVYTQTNASTRQGVSPGPNAPFSCVQWRVFQVQSSPAQYAFESRRWQPDWEANPSALVTGWRYVTDPLPTVSATFLVPSTAQNAAMLGGRLLRVSVSLNNQSANKTVSGNPTKDLTLTRDLTGSNVLSTATSTGAPNPCIWPNGTVPS